MPTLSRVSLSSFAWPLEAILAEPLLITGAPDTAKLDTALAPLLTQFIGGSRGGGLLLSGEKAVAAALARSAADAGRTGDLVAFCDPTLPEPVFTVPARFHLLSCLDVPGADYADILLDPTASERIAEQCQPHVRRTELAARREQAKAALAEIIDHLRSEAFPGQPLSLSIISETLVNARVDPVLYRLICDRFSALFWSNTLHDLFFSEQPNTFALDDIIIGSKVITFELPGEPAAAVEYAATVIKRLFLHRAACAAKRPDTDPLWLIVEGDGVFLDPNDLRAPNLSKNPLALVVCSSSLSMVALTQDSTGYGRGMGEVVNRVMFRPQAASVGLFRSVDPLPPGVEPMQLRSLSDHQAVLMKRGHQPRAVVLSGGWFSRTLDAASGLVEKIKPRQTLGQGC